MSDVIAFEAQVKGIGNIKDLRQAIKEAKSELLQFEAGTEGFSRAQAKVSALTDKMNGLGDSARIQGTATERLSQSFGLLGESLRGADLEKAKVAFTGIGQAMSAIPIFLLVEGLNYLIQNFDKVIELVKDFTGETKKAEQAIRDENNAIQEQVFLAQELSAEYKNYAAGREHDLAMEMELLKRRGATAQEMALAEIKAEEDKLAKMKSIKAKADEEGLNTTKAQRAIFDQLDKIELLNARLKTEQILENKKIGNQKIIDLEAELNAELLKLEDDLRLEAEAQQAEFDGIFRDLEAQNRENDLTAYLDFETRKMLQGVEIEKKGAKMKSQIDAQKLSEDKKNAATRTKLENDVFNAAKSLSDGLFAFQLAKARGNQAEELKIRKQAFELDKAFSIAKATNDGYKAVLSSYADTPGGPLIKGIAAAAAGIFAAGQILKIASSQFDGGQTSTSSSFQNTQTNIPSLPSPTQTRQGTTLLDDFGNPITQQQKEQQVIRAYLLDKEVSSKMKNVKRIEEQSKF